MVLQHFSRVSASRLETENISWIKVNSSKPKITIPAKTPYAIVTDEQGTNDLGYVLYRQRNGLPYSEFTEEANHVLLNYGENQRFSRAYKVKSPIFTTKFKNERKI